MDKRVLFSKAGTLEDLSTVMNEYRSSGKIFNYKAGEDALFIGSRLPFNHFFFKLKQFNFSSTSIIVEYWNGKEWKKVVECIDETEGFQKSGYVTFVPDRSSSWKMSSTNYQSQTVQGLESVNIYDLYWIKITFTNDFQGSENEGEEVTYSDVILQWLGNMFANDNDLAGEHPDKVRPNVMNAFEKNKTSWEEQHSIAAKLLIKDLISRNIIDGSSQILNRSDYTLAAISKVLELICNGLGDDYIDDKKAARAEYLERINLRIHKVDLNKNAIEDVPERVNTTGWIGR